MKIHEIPVSMNPRIGLETLSLPPPIGLVPCVGMATAGFSGMSTGSAVPFPALANSAKKSTVQMLFSKQSCGGLTIQNQTVACHGRKAGLWIHGRILPHMEELMFPVIPEK